VGALAIHEEIGMSKLSSLLRRTFRRPKPHIPEWKLDRSPERRSFALNQLDWKLEPWIARSGGFFIEAGANDGVSQSNSLYFEKYYGWRGLLVEPIPVLADRCRNNRPDCLVVNSALVPFGHPEPTVEMHACNLMSLVKGAMKSESADLQHVQRGCVVQQVETEQIRVPAIPLSDLLDRHGIKQVDLLSLDVEGYELPVLQGLDLQRHRPRWMLIEAWFREEVDQYLRPYYRAVAELSHHDVLYQAIDK
jgi:FkbM family methyltransferase